MDEVAPCADDDVYLEDGPNEVTLIYGLGGIGGIKSPKLLILELDFLPIYSSSYANRLICFVSLSLSDFNSLIVLSASTPE